MKILLNILIKYYMVVRVSIAAERRNESFAVWGTLSKLLCNHISPIVKCNYKMITFKYKFNSPLITMRSTHL